MSKRNPVILVADDDAAIRIVVGEALRQEGLQVIEAEDVQELMRLVREGRGDLVISDVLMPDGSGLDALPEIVELRPNLPVIIMSAQNTLNTAMSATNRGAYDYLPKPFDIDEMVQSVRKGLLVRGTAVDDLEQADESGGLIGRSPAMQDIYRAMSRVVQTELTVLIHGESGTGKELVARAIHEHSHRRDNAFVPVNMAAIPKEPDRK